MAMRPGQAKGPNVQAGGGGGGVTGYVSSGLLTEEMFADKVNAQHVNPYGDPVGGLGTGTIYKYLDLKSTPNPHNPNTGPEIRALVKPPQDYAGKTPLKIRHWGFLPDEIKSAWSIVPTPEIINIDAWCWWRASGSAMFTGYFGSATAISSANFAAVEKIYGTALANMIPDPAAGAWADGSILYLWLTFHSATCPNEIGLLGTEILWPI